MLNGASIKCSNIQLVIAAKVNTKVVAKPMLNAESSFFDTPINGQRPKNFTRTTLLTRAVPNKSKRYSLTVFSTLMISIFNLLMHQLCQFNNCADTAGLADKYRAMETKSVHENCCT